MLSLLLSLTLTSLPSSAAQTAAPVPPPIVAAPVQTPPPAPVTSRTTDPRAYVIGPQDVLRITVFDEPTLSGTYKIGTDGAFDYPYINRIDAIGKTLRDLETEIEKKLADGYVRRPQVTVEIDQFRSRNIFVMGEVRNASKYPLTGQMTLLEALVAAGYVTQNAGSQIQLVRQPPDKVADQPLAPGQGVETLRISLIDVQAGKPEANILLREGDSIYVPRAERFYVSGLVKSPGVFAHEPGMTVLQALSLAGGVSEKGSTRGIKIKRKVNGKEIEIGVGIGDVVQPGDTIVVRQKRL